MGTQTDQRYVVHLDIPAVALNATGAVEDALEQVRAVGARDKFAWSVEAVGRDNGATQHHLYPNEFLG